jgi:hypothetical protein
VWNEIDECQKRGGYGVGNKIKKHQTRGRVKECGMKYRGTNHGRGALIGSRSGYLSGGAPKKGS